MPAGGCLTPFPGLYCPGLIEALTQTYEAACTMRFPGLYCPGLIEAITGTGKGWVGTHSFRGSIAPASLKQKYGVGIRPAPGSVSGALLPRPH